MIRLLVCLLVAVLLTDCSEQGIINKFASAEEQASARAYLDQIHAHDFTAIERDIDPSLKTTGFEDMLEKMANLPPSGEPNLVKPIGAQRFEGPGEKSINITFEYNFGDNGLSKTWPYAKKTALKLFSA